MNVEKRLLSKILLEKDIKPVLDARVQADFFVDEQIGQVFEWIIWFYQEHGETPTADALARNYPWFDVVRAPEPLSYYIQELLAAREYAILHDGAVDIAAAMRGGDTEQAIMHMRKCMASLEHDLTPMRDLNLTDEEYHSQWTEEYAEQAKYDGSLRGMPTGFRTVDRATSGFRPGQLITIIGEAKAGKSTALLLMAKAVHDAGHVPLFIGFEMSNEEQRNRYVAIRGGIDYHRLDNATLKPDQYKRFQNTLRELSNTPDLWFSADPTSTSTVSGILAKIDAYSPACVFIDGAYMMVDEQTGEQNTPLALTHITRSLKRLAQRREIPIVITTQALTWKINKKRGLTADTIGYSSSFVQDSDVILGLESVENEDEIKRLKVVAGRNLKNFVVDLQWSWAPPEFKEMENGFEAEDDEDSA